MTDKKTKPSEDKYPLKNSHFHFTIDKKYVAVIVLIVIVLVLGLLKVFFFHSVTTPPLQSSTKMKLYSDKSKNFTIEIPQNWETSTVTNQATTGLNTQHPVTQQIETTQMFLPGEIGVTIQIYEASPSCPLSQQLTTQINNFPASYDATLHAWTIFTTQSTITITIAYPGSGGFMDSTTTPAPGETNQDIQLLKRILQTVKLYNAQPLSC